jgi:hypothetical protein
MVEDSVEHAFEDMAARQWIEAKLRAQETATAARKGLAMHRGELDDATFNTVESALLHIEKLIAAESGNAKELKTALGELDAATKPLADLMMDKAMEALLRKRGLIQ